MRFEKRVLERFSIKGLKATGEKLSLWSKTDFGSYVLAAERDLIAEKYSALPGYRVMHLGLTADRRSADEFSQIHRFNFQAHTDHCGAGISAVADLTELPLPSDVVDVVLLQHTLEFSESPQSVLAEVCRTITPGGHLIVCVLDPFGPMGVAKLPMQLLTDSPQYRFHSLRAGRLLDWLTLLNFEVDAINHGAHQLPFAYRVAASQMLEGPEKLRLGDSWDRGCQRIGLPFGNFYMIHAVKRVSRMIGNPPRSWKAAARGRLSVSTSQSLGSTKKSINKHSAEHKL
jgi:SAM-dependent methyltransferase